MNNTYYEMRKQSSPWVDENQVIQVTLLKNNVFLIIS